MAYYNHDAWTNNNNNQSIEAMDISLGRNTSTEDMEMDEATKTSPEFFPRFISFTSGPSEGDVRNRHCINEFPKYHQVPPDLSNRPMSNNTLNQGWQQMLQTLDTPVSSTANQQIIPPQSDCIHQQQQQQHYNNETNNNSNKQGVLNINEDQNQQTDKLKPHVLKSIRPLCGTTKSNKKMNGDKCWMLFLFISTSVLAILTVYSSIYIQLHFISQCYDSNDYDETILQNKLTQNLFGQEIAVNVIPGILKDYLKRNQDIPKTKPLVLSMHGWTGVGKNYASRIIAESFSSKSFVKFLIPLHFPHAVDDDVYHQQIIEWIDSNITQCHINIFLFDEMDKATPGVISGIQTAIINQSNKSSSETPVIFMLLSNSKGAEINKIVFSDEKSLEVDFKDVFSDSTSWFSSFNSKNLIDNFIPFLPLEKSHVEQCIYQDGKQKNLKISAINIEQILKELSFVSVPGTSKEYSKTGCKRVSDKVDLVMYMYQ